MADTKMKVRVEPRNSHRAKQEGGAVPHQIYFEFGSFGGFAPLTRAELEGMVTDLRAVLDGTKQSVEFEFRSER